MRDVRPLFLLFLANISADVLADGCNHSFVGDWHGDEPGRQTFFPVPAEWRDRCFGAASSSPLPRQNRCWAETKSACRIPGDATTWQQKQESAARRGLAPPHNATAFLPLAEAQLCERAEEGAATGAGVQELAEATVWLNGNVRIWVLSPADEGRRAKVRWHFAELGLEFLFVDTAAEAALPASRARGHLAALALAERGDHPVSLVLEEDARLVRDFAVKLRRLVEEEAPCEWDAISLRSICPVGTCISQRLVRVALDQDSLAEGCGHGLASGLSAMLYAKKSIHNVSKHLNAARNGSDCTELDGALAVADGLAYFAVPHVQFPGFLEAAEPRVLGSEEGVAAPPAVLVDRLRGSRSQPTVVFPGRRTGALACFATFVMACLALRARLSDPACENDFENRGLLSVVAPSQGQTQRTLVSSER